MIGRFATLVLALLLAAPPAARAQEQRQDNALRVELGLAAIGADSNIGGGGYAGMSAPGTGVDWLEPYAALSMFSEWSGVAGVLVDAGHSGFLLHGGANIRLGPRRWWIQPRVRLGAGLAKRGRRTEFTGAIGGVGLYTIGGSWLWGLVTSGGALAVDFWSTEAATAAVAHAGIYLRFN